MRIVQKGDKPEESVGRSPSSQPASIKATMKIGKFKVRCSIVFAVTGIVLVLIGFLTGVAVRGSFGNGTTFLGFPVATDGTDNSSETSSGSNLETSISEIQTLLGDESVINSTASAVTSSDTATATIGTLLENVGDPYARYYSADEYAQYKNRSSASSVGLGVVLSEYQGKAYVVSVGSGTPAAVAGLQPGDFITSVDGESKSSWDTDAVVDACQGSVGTQVTLTWRRPMNRDDAGGETFAAVLTISEIAVPDVTSQLIDGVGYISILQFGSTSFDEVAAAVDSLNQQGASGYVLDIRSSTGGHIDQVVDIASLFISEGTVVQISSKSGVTQAAVDTSKYLTDKPLAVLVNGDTASCSEVFAAAIQDSDRGTVIGSTTFGKGAVQTIKELSVGGAIKFTIAYYLGADGETIDGVGVTPSISIAMDQKLIGTNQDTQLAAALDVLGVSRTTVSGS